MKFEQTFGDSIKKLREERNLTLREVAEILKIDTSMLAKVEKNKRKPTKQLITGIAQYFGVSEKELTIAFLSDAIVQQVTEEDDAIEVIKVAEQKIKLKKTIKQ